MVEKIKVQTSTDDELLKECKEKTDCGECEPISWTTPSKGTEIEPPRNTVAVVVDLVNHVGAIRIFEKGGLTRVGNVGTEEAGNMVIVPWNSKLWFRALGSVRVGYIVEKDSTDN